MKTFYLYEYVDTNTNEPFYIGKGTINTKGNKYGRSLDHVRGRSKEFKKAVKEREYKINIVFETEDEKECYNEENKRILEIGRISTGKGPLVNKSEGGKNPLSGRKMSDEEKARRAENKKKWWASPAGIARKKELSEKMKDNDYGAANSGRKWSDEEKQKKKVYWESEEGKKRKAEMAEEKKGNTYGEVTAGRVVSDETRKKLSEIGKKRFADGWVHPMQGRNHTKESCEKISQGHFGLNHSEETKRKMSESQRKRRQEEGLS